MGTATGRLRTVQTLRARVPAEGTAGTGGEYALGRNPFGAAAAVTAARYLPDTTVTGVATNNKTIEVISKGTNGTGTTSTASISFGNGTNAPAFDDTALTLNATTANRDVVADAMLSIKSTVVGTGMVLPAGLIEVDLTVD